MYTVCNSRLTSWVFCLFLSSLFLSTLLLYFICQPCQKFSFLPWFLTFLLSAALENHYGCQLYQLLMMIMMLQWWRQQQQQQLDSVSKYLLCCHRVCVCCVLVCFLPCPATKLSSDFQYVLYQVRVPEVFLFKLLQTSRKSEFYCTTSSAILKTCTNFSVIGTVLGIVLYSDFCTSVKFQKNSIWQNPGSSS